MNRHDMSQSSQTLDNTLSKEISIISVTKMTNLIDYIFNIVLIIVASGRFSRPDIVHADPWRGQYVNLDETFVKLKHHK